MLSKFVRLAYKEEFNTKKCCFLTLVFFTICAIQIVINKCLKRFLVIVSNKYLKKEGNSNIASSSVLTLKFWPVINTVY